MAINDPTEIADLVAWFAADALALAHNDPVASWPDGSAEGNDLAQATGSLQPTYIAGELNGRPIVRFVDDWMQVTLASVATQPTTVFILAKMFHTGTGGVMMDGVSSSNRQYFGSFGAGDQNITTWSGGSLDSGFNTPESEYVLWTLRYQEGAAFIRRNGTQVASTATGGGNSMGGITLACRYNVDVGRCMDADVAEMIVYDAGLTTGEIEDVEDYLQRWFPVPPGTPTITVDAENATSVDASTSAFVAGAGGSHTHTRWQVRTLPGRIVVFDSGDDASNLLTIDGLASGLPLVTGKRYEVGAAHKEDDATYSEFGWAPFTAGGTGISGNNYLLLSGDAQSGGDVLLLTSSDELDPVSGLLLSGDATS